MSRVIASKKLLPPNPTIGQKLMVLHRMFQDVAVNMLDRDIDPETGQFRVVFEPSPFKGTQALVEFRPNPEEIR